MSNFARCRFCGAREHSKISGVYLCGSVVSKIGMGWIQSNTCGENCLQIRVQLEGTVEILRRRIEAAKQRLESLNGQHAGQAEIYAVIAILEGKA